MGIAVQLTSLFRMATRKFLLPIVLALTLFAASCSRGTADDADSNDDIATLEDEAASTDDADNTDDTDGEGSDSDDDSAEQSDSEPEGTTTTVAELEPEEAALQFSQCMRDEGIADFPDLGIDGNGNIDLDDIPADFQGDADVQDAFDVCQPLIEAGGFGERIREVVESPEFNDALIEFSDCIRDEGFDVGDLTIVGLAGAAFASPDGAANPQGGDREEGFGDRDAIFAEALGLDPDDPKVEAAVNKCIPKIEGAMADLGFGE